MPRYLHLLRHAQSADKQTGQTDKERTLTDVGLAEARAVGIFFKEKSSIPELIITSSAIRAKTTSQVVADVLAYSASKIIIEDELYEAQVSSFFKILTAVDQHINSVLIIAHNPAISFFAAQISNQQNSFRPAEVLTFKSEAGSWKDVQRGNSELVGRFHPLV